MAGAFSAHLSELDILGEDLGIGHYVYPYEIPYQSPTLTERARQREDTWQRLRSAGFADSRGLDPEVEDLLRAWERPQVLVTQIATMVETGTHFLYRGGWSGKLGFLSDQDGETLVFKRLRPEQVVPEMVSFLPNWAPIKGGPTTVVTHGYAPEQGDGDQPMVTDEPEDPGAGDMRAAERFFASPSLRYGMIKCSARQPDTRTTRGAEVDLGSMSWFDTTEGRFFVVTEDLPGGDKRHTFTPADSGRIAQWVRDRLNRALA